MTDTRASVDVRFMQLALELAGKSRPSPNPRVGACVVDATGTVVGQGFHVQPGKPHAEIIALEQAGAQASEADLYVTLEPCCHRGRTGPCVDAISKAGISRVIVGMVDPDPRMRGQGLARLREKNIEVVVGVAEEDCARLLAGYKMHRTQGRPAITLKAAITLDGALATMSGSSKWISSERSRQEAHRMRAFADAVLVGIGTVISDDPQLTVRHCTGDNPLRVVMDSGLRIPLDSNLIRSRDQGPLVIAHVKGDAETAEQLAAMEGIDLLQCASTDDQRVDPGDLMVQLGKRGVTSVLVEGGSKIHGAFASARLADYLALFTAPKILGAGIPWIQFAGVESINDAVQLRDLKVNSLDTDLLIEGRFTCPDQPNTVTPVK